jgi:hypothetical protein
MKVQEGNWKVGYLMESMETILAAHPMSAINEKGNTSGNLSGGNGFLALQGE